MKNGKLQFGPAKLRIHTYRLESVGTILTYDGMTYPMDDGTVDYDNLIIPGMHLRNIEPDGDWMTSLSVDDRKTVDSVMASPNYRATLRSYSWK